MLNYFYVSGAVGIAGLVGAYYYAGFQGMAIAAVLCVLEISLSFDNSIINAAVLKDMSDIWRRRFLTWGILIAVFGMRLVFPLSLVAFITHLNLLEVLDLALKQPERYSEYLIQAHTTIAAFGGMFLLMVFLYFILDNKRNVHWLGVFEKKIAQIGILEYMHVVFALIILLSIQSFAAPEKQAVILVSGLYGIVTYIVIHSLAKYLNQRFINLMQDNVVKKSGFISFLYLEILDASFSFDGVIGAFAITTDIVIIMIGLGVGAFFVRSITIFLVEKKALQNYIYLEHGANYALGALALMMLVGIFYHISEVFMGAIGIIFITSSYFSSLWAIRQQRNK